MGVRSINVLLSKTMIVMYLSLFHYNCDILLEFPIILLYIARSNYQHSAIDLELNNHLGLNSELSISFISYTSWPILLHSLISFNMLDLHLSVIGCKKNLSEIIWSVFWGLNYQRPQIQRRMSNNWNVEYVMLNIFPLVISSQMHEYMQWPQSSVDTVSPNNFLLPTRRGWTWNQEWMSNGLPVW